MKDVNREQLVTAARLLRPLLHELVFVGGPVIGLLITDEGGGTMRTTLDVDAIAEISSYSEYALFGERLRRLGFAEDAREGSPVCRWVHGLSMIDIMPLNEQILGFSNRWYRGAIQSAVVTRLTADLRVRIITAPFFVATKLEAFNGRGEGDFFGSHDLEDPICVIDGRPQLLSEFQSTTYELRSYVSHSIQHLLAMRRFVDALPGYLLPDETGQARVAILMGRLKGLAAF